MAFLLSLDPAKSLGFRDKLNFKDIEGGQDATEKELFEALWIGFKTGDTPKFGKELKSSMSLDKDFTEHSIEGGSIKLAVCGGCGQRIGRHGDLRTIDQKIDLVLDDAAFEYLKASLQRWERTFAEVKPYFAELHERFEAMKAKSPEEWKKRLAEEEQAKGSSAIHVPVEVAAGPGQE